jgi:hypothetical protein
MAQSLAWIAELSEGRTDLLRSPLTPTQRGRVLGRGFQSQLQHGQELLALTLGFDARALGRELEDVERVALDTGSGLLLAHFTPDWKPF